MNQKLDVSSAIYSPQQLKDRNSCSTDPSEDHYEIEEIMNSID